MLSGEEHRRRGSRLRRLRPGSGPYSEAQLSAALGEAHARPNVPGFLAVAHDAGGRRGARPSGTLALLGVADATASSFRTWSWRLGASAPARPTPERPLLLSGTNWSDRGSVSAVRLGQWMSADSLDPVRSMLPPFAALGAAGDGLVLASDTMGFRQLFRRRGPAWLGLSTSARALAALGDGRLDREALLLQSLLGWQLGQRTLFDGVTKLDPGEYVHVTGGTVTAGWSPLRTPRRSHLTRRRPGPPSCSVRFSRAIWTRTQTRPSSSPAGRTPAWC